MKKAEIIEKLYSVYNDGVKHNYCDLTKVYEEIIEPLKEQLKAKEEENEKLKEISNALVDELEGTTKTDFTFRIIDTARELLNK